MIPHIAAKAVVVVTTVKIFSRIDQQIPATATAIEIASAVQGTPATFQIFTLCLAEVFIGKK